MYEGYWQLSRRPFESGLEAGMYYPCDTHQAALLKLRYAIENRRGGAVLAGASGLGKSMVARLLAERLPEDCRPCAHLVFPQLPAADLLACTAAALGAEIPLGTSPAPQESVRQIERRLLDNAARGRHTVLIVDEAHLLVEQRTLETLRLLMNFEHAGRPAATLLLVGQTGLLPALARMPQFDERLAVKCMLRPLSPAETSSYVEHRLHAAGATRSLFDTAALDALYEHTRGVPRRINRLADLALLIGFAEELPQLGPEQVHSVAEELVAVAAE